MKSIDRRKFIIALLMFGGAGLALAMKPTQKIADRGPRVDLETMIPAQFSDWQIDPSVIPITVTPDVQAALDRIYNQTLSRTYINSKGERVMLSIAYGGDQGRTMQVHRPEVCYASQGFQIGSTSKAFIDINEVKLPIMRLVATLGSRIEPITYWVIIGDSAVRGNLEQGFARLKYGLTGRIPYGLLVRVSNLSIDSHQSYALQEQFIKDMLSAITRDNHALLIGSL